MQPCIYSAEGMFAPLSSLLHKKHWAARCSRAIVVAAERKQWQHENYGIKINSPFQPRDILWESGEEEQGKKEGILNPGQGNLEDKNFQSVKCVMRLGSILYVENWYYQSMDSQWILDCVQVFTDPFTNVIEAFLGN